MRRGGNYGWRLMEGRSCYRPASGCERPGLELPIAEYEHGQGRCSITGGYVYRGAAIPELVGTYLFGDYCSGEIFGLRQGQTRCCSTPVCGSHPSARTRRARSTWSTSAARSIGSSGPGLTDPLRARSG